MLLYTTYGRREGICDFLKPFTFELYLKKPLKNRANNPVGILPRRSLTHHTHSAAVERHARSNIPPSHVGGRPLFYDRRVSRVVGSRDVCFGRREGTYNFVEPFSCEFSFDLTRKRGLKANKIR